MKKMAEIFDLPFTALQGIVLLENSAHILTFLDKKSIQSSNLIKF